MSPAVLQEAYLVNALVTLHRANFGVYGVRKMWHLARREGLPVGRDQVARLMAVGGVSGAVRGRHRTRTTFRDPAAARHPDLVNRNWAAPTGPDLTSCGWPSRPSCGSSAGLLADLADRVLGRGL